MKKQTNNIPALAYMEAQIIHRASAQGLLAPVVRSVETEYGLHLGLLKSGVFLETRTLSLLYLLIVVPKEFWGLGNNHQIYQRINESWSLEMVNIIVCNSPWREPIYRFIHHLRNAMAHANFQFKNGNIEFWDQPRNKHETYRASLSTAAMQQFLEVVGSLFANLKNEETA
ncbi:MAG TPA: HEPN family nuclease [Methylotenera sp.]|nr:HEPN family nuclease [Methylotenera sp.]